MFGSKHKRKQNNSEKVKLAKRILGKDSGRRVFGFPCSPDIPARLKVLANQIQVPIYALCEHAFQLSTGLISKMAENSGERDSLRQHIIVSHVEARTIEKIGAYDADMAERLDQERLRSLDIDRAAHQIVVNFIRRGLNPQEIPWCIDYGMRCRIAIAQGRPVPTDLPQDV